MDHAIIRKDVDDTLAAVDLGWVQGKDVLITGATGLLGTYFLYTLLALVRKGLGPERVCAVIHRQLPEHLEAFQNEKWLSFVRGSLADPAFCATLPKADAIIHAAGYAQPSRFMKQEMDALKINTAATCELLEHLNEGGKFLFISSCSVYTGNPGKAFAETEAGFSNTDHPRCCYIEGKRGGEAACNIARHNGIDCKSVRLSFTYGPGVKKDDTRAMYAFIAKALADGDIRMLDRGAAVHTYCYISDAMEEMWNILLNGKQGIYNVAGHSETSILALAQAIGKELGATVAVPEEERGVAGALQREYVSPERYENEFGKRAFVPLEEGLRRTVGWYRQYYAG
jgi:UDP-glucuronate decarboxylase